MYMDIRLPIGLLFTLVGALLTGYGLVTDPIARATPEFDLNLVWGVVLLVFGVAFLFMSRRRTSGVARAEATPEGRATEAREHRLGLEQERGGG